jgi:L-lactate dehydrogenase complex protein LldG
MSSREYILNKLRQRSDESLPFPSVTAPTHYQPMIPAMDPSPAALQARFITEAQNAACVVHIANSPDAAIGEILNIIGNETSISSWEPTQIPLPGLAEALDKANMIRVGQDADVRVGLSGVDAALAATGSLVVSSGEGRYRATSLLPPIHIAVVCTDQIVPDLESWWAAQKRTGLEQTQKHSNIVVITGPSRTADIAMQLVMGMHGPKELHVILIG